MQHEARCLHNAQSQLQGLQIQQAFYVIDSSPAQDEEMVIAMQINQQCLHDHLLGNPDP